MARPFSLIMEADRIISRIGDGTHSWLNERGCSILGVSRREDKRAVAIASSITDIRAADLPKARTDTAAAMHDRLNSVARISAAISSSVAFHAIGLVMPE